MLALISPAKSLDYDSPLPDFQTTSSRFPRQTAELARGAARLKAADLKRLMHISDTLSELNARRYAGFLDQPERPAIYAFAGDVYVGFEARTLAEEAVLFAQEHVRILSGLYGLLRPLDNIRPYRLEMGTRWAPKAKSLYAFWGNSIANLISKDLSALETNVLINLASNEYWKAAEGHIPPHVRVIDIDFREEGPNGLRFNSFAAKRARGMMARFMCENFLSDPASLKGFDSDGYAFDAEASTEKMWRFVRR
ncbi:peroxide stress protein YaaA [Rhizorhapis suberifaciens]|uniref:UPF0246 protein HNQ99_002203 n=1 Tax=Rhizorhapis suberifaciens TaxID=13656 RepID=A0A840HV07_9SPHN|nr:peroxide stress protein YaaA [Rhizorhapis suberifaciens]MBB4641885.1 hypothetical protein [Rhizorhapis suberifaciens]